MRSALCAVICLPAIAHADSRLDLTPIPALDVLDVIYPLDRDLCPDVCDRDGGRTRMTVAIGAGRVGDARGATGEASIDVGEHTAHVVAGASSDLQLDGGTLTRGHHRVLADYHSDYYGEHGSSLAVDATLDHGLARGLAPVELGPGRRVSGDAIARALLQLSKHKDDTAWSAEIEGGAGATRWLDADSGLRAARPGLLDHAEHRSLGLAIGRMVGDHELPSGTIDLIRARVDAATITRGTAATTAVRTVEVGVGLHDFIAHIDHDTLAAVTADLGWSWLEADADRGALADNMFRMRLATAVDWLHDRDRSHLGVALARLPGHSADGQVLVSEWRLALESGLDTRRYVVSASGGLSWLTPVAGGEPADTTVLRYGSHLEGFAKIAHGVELGGYAAVVFEPNAATSPWAAPRVWSNELGVVVRLRAARNPTPPYRPPPAPPEPPKRSIHIDEDPILPKDDGPLDFDLDSEPRPLARPR